MAETFLSLIGPCELIHSQIEDKDMIMNRFRKKEYPILVTTTLLERESQFRMFRFWCIDQIILCLPALH